MNGFTFTLDPYVIEPERKGAGAARVGRRGIVGPFGEVAVEYVEPVPGPGGEHRSSSEVRGDAVPLVRFTGRVLGGPPSLDGGRLTVDGAPVSLAFNARGLTNEARALHLGYAGRDLTYTSQGLHKGGELRGEGIRIVLEPGAAVRIGRARQKATVGSAEGPVDAVAVALAVLFEEVDTYLLTLGGAAAAAPFRALGRLFPPGGAGA